MTFTPADVMVLIPVLNRPHLVAPLARNLELVCPETSVRWLPSMGDNEELYALDNAAVPYWLDAKAHTWAEKINVGYRTSGHRLLFCAADDVYFHPGWVEQILERMVLGVRVVGTLDHLTTNVMAGEHSTHYMVDRRYLDEVGGVIDQGPGSFMNETYRHNYTDNEFVQTAQHRGVFAPSKAVVEHVHHLNGAADYDDTYKLGDESMQADANKFFKRQHLWA